ncbi:MAG: hypothetical protein AB8G05_13915 [Oligoflexales bacterium]
MKKYVLLFLVLNIMCKVALANTEESEGFEVTLDQSAHLTYILGLKQKGLMAKITLGDLLLKGKAYKKAIQIFPFLQTKDVL